MQNQVDTAHPSIYNYASQEAIACRFSIEVPQKQVRGVREVCPQAGIFFRFHLNNPK
ncbi:MAG: hypothetical protein KDD01_15085 [Phaeodactylibacter sp.]|nr:hypothetical protein [Phaeodactylibacter sp.]